jgi:quercetin dioxygenase-like cupin family protein
MEQLGLSLAIFPRGYATHGHGAHVDREHAYYVVSGAMEVTIGGQTSSAGPGDVVFFPRGIEHDHRNSGEGDLVVLIVRTPVPATKA